MAEFDSTKFLESKITSQSVDSLKKAQLISLADALHIEYETPVKKPEIKVLVIGELVKQGLLPETVATGQTMSEFEFKLAMERLQIQREEKQLTREREERDFRLRELEMRNEQELRMLESKKESGSKSKNLEVVRNVKLVPKFNEKEVDRYFQHFEKIAITMEWNKEIWALLLQSVLVGKAQEIYSALSVEQSSDYEIVKARILQAYELVPEAYRQKFRNISKQIGQTHVEFAREKENLFDRWCMSKHVDNEFDNLKQLVLLEEFKRCVITDIRTHLDEQNVKDLENAAVMADDYALTHKPVFQQKHQFIRPKYPLGKDQVKSGGSGPDKKVLDPEKRGKGEKPAFKVPTCYYCNRKGHLMSNCFVLEKDKKEKKAVNLLSQRESHMAKYNANVSQGENVFSPKVAEIKKSGFESFLSEGSVSFMKGVDEKPILVLRDTGAAQTVLLQDHLPSSEETSEHADVLVEGVEGGFKSIPLHKVYLKTKFLNGPVTVGVVTKIPVEGVGLLLGNDLAGDKVQVAPCVTEVPVYCTDTELLGQKIPGLFPACVVTRSLAKKAQAEANIHVSKRDEGNDVSLEDTFFGQLEASSQLGPIPGEVTSGAQVAEPGPDNSQVRMGQLPCGREMLIEQQKADPDLVELREKALTPDEATLVPICYFVKSGVLMRKFRPPEVPAEDEWKVIYQIVVPSPYRKEILEMAHELPIAGHLGINKTQDRILQHFFWPKLRYDVAQFVKTCHTCQMVGKPNQPIKPAPLQPIPAFEEPFSKVIIDCVGPLPKTKAGNMYLLTIMCASTRFPEAIPLRNITSKLIIKALTKFFTLFGMPKELQSDQGSNFTSGIFQQTMYSLGIKHFTSSAYHPQSQGALERYHQTLKNMIKAYCFENQKDWDEAIHMLLFATREVVQQSLGFSPFELVFGHTVRGPLKVIKEEWLKETETQNLLDYVSNFNYRLHKACEMARTHLIEAQIKMKTWYDQKARERMFKPGDKVLVLLPIPGEPLRARYKGPYKITKKVNDLNYVVCTPDRRKSSRMCHINMMKEYFERGEKVKPVMMENVVNVECDDEKCETDPSVLHEKPECGPRLSNSEVLQNMDAKLSHLDTDKQNQLVDLLNQYDYLFGDSPGQTNLTCHDVDIGHARPIKQHPYRLNPRKLKEVRKKIKYMIDHKIWEPGESEWFGGFTSQIGPSEIFTNYSR